MKISIVIPTYNRAHIIEPAIKSILKQTLTDWELIIVDDGSTDNTAEVIEKYLSDSRVNYIQKENSGAAESRNVGVANATAEVITFLDSDDEAEPHWLQTMAERMEQDRADLVCCGLSRLDADGKIIEVKMPKKQSALFNGITCKITNGGSYMLKKPIFKEIGGFDKDLQAGQHTELAMRLVPYIEAKGLKISNIYESLIRINIHDGERIRTNYKAKYLGSSHTYHKHYNLFKKSKNAKSRFEGIIAFNAYKLGYYAEARAYGLKSFLTKPTIKDFLRYTKYLLTVKGSNSR